MNKYTIVIPTYNQLDKLKKQREAFDNQTYKDFRLLYAVDGSDDGTMGWLEKGDDTVVKRERNEQNKRGYNEVCNLAGGAVFTPFMLFINGDSIPKEDYLEKIDKVAQENRIVTGLRLNVDDKMKIAATDHRLDWFPEGVDKPFKIERERPWEKQTSNGMAVATKLWKELDGFDEKYRGYGVVDLDFCMRAHFELGIESWWQPEAILYHMDLVDKKDNLDNFEIYSKRRERYENSL